MSSRLATRLQFVPLEQIDPRDDFYSLPGRDARQNNRLRRSIEIYGIASPLILEEDGPERHRIVDGFRRFGIAHELGHNEVPVRLARGSPLDLFLLTLNLNASLRNLTELDFAELAVRMKSDFGFAPERISRELSPLFGSLLSGEAVSRLERLGSLPEPLKAAARERLTPNAAVNLARWPEEDWRLFLEVTENLRLGGNKQRELLELLGEVSRREGVGAAGIWETSGAAQIAASETLSPADRYRGVKAALQRLRYPMMSRCEDRVRVLRREMLLPRGVDLRLPPFFEGDRVEITLRPASSAELLQALEKLRSGPVLNGFDEIFEML